MGVEYKYGKFISMEKLGRTISWRKRSSDKINNVASTLKFIGERTVCPICSCDESKPYVTIYQTSYHECANCGHLYQYKIVDPEFIKTIYENESSYLSYAVDELYHNTRIEMIAKPKVEYITEQVREREREDKTLEWLDIGCGACEFLVSAKNLGWKVKGVETSNIGKICGDRYDIPVIQQYVTEKNAGEVVKNSYLVSLFNVMEHLEYPKEIIKAISDSSDCEYLVIEVPHHPSLTAFCCQLFPRQIARLLIVPDHIHLFTEKSLTLLLEDCGFEVTNCWKYGQDFYEVISMLTQQAENEQDREITMWPKEIFSAINEVQTILDKHDLCDSMLMIAKRKR